MLSLVVLISGGGSNLAALLDTVRDGGLPVRVLAVGADREAAGLEHAVAHGIPTFTVPYREFANREAWGEALLGRLLEFDADLIVLSGLMRLLPPAVVSALDGRIINTHPAYLPEFPGAHAVRDALAAGVTETGASVILVDTGIDSGPILAQRRIAVHDDDTEESLHERIKTVERELLVDVLNDLSSDAESAPPVHERPPRVSSAHSHTDSARPATT